MKKTDLRHVAEISMSVIAKMSKCEAVRVDMLVHMPAPL
jgi:DNA-binding Xre family transcriptional regulator